MKHCTTDKCPQILDSSCVFYEGTSLIFSGINTNDSVETVIQKLNLKLESIPTFNSNNYYNKVEIDSLIKNYIPLQGTLSGFPLIGNIEFSPGDNIKLYSNSGYIMIDDSFITLSSLNNNNIYVNTQQVFLNSGNLNNRKYINFSTELDHIPLQSNITGAGLVGQNYYGDNYVDTSFVQKKFVIDTFNNIDLSNYYTKGQTYSKNEVDALFTQTYNYIDDSIVNYNNTIQAQLGNYYTKVEINSQFLNYYTRTEVDTALSTKQANLGFTPENVANKQNSLSIDGTGTKYPTIDAVNSGLDEKENNIISGTISEYFRGDKTWQTLDKNSIGLNNVNNTSDLNKPISTATQAAIDLKADKHNPIFTGTVSGITPDMIGAPSGSGTVIGNNTGDNSPNSLYSGLISNATHTGEVEGDFQLTLNKTSITNKTNVVASLLDEILISDESDLGKLKKVNIQSVVDLVPTINETIISNIIVLNFLKENDKSSVTIFNSSITNLNIKAISFIPIETAETSLDDFSLNGLNFSVVNIVDNTSFDIIGTAINNASGNYTIKYIITINN